MRIIALFLVLCPLVTSAQEFSDAATGLVVDLPDRWERDTLREKGAVKFVGLYDIAKGKYIRFTIEAVPAENFTTDSWLRNEKEDKKKYLKEVSKPFTKDAAASSAATPRSGTR